MRDEGRGVRYKGGELRYEGEGVREVRYEGGGVREVWCERRG